ncbi:phenazine biosynthesis FMN-dependent oxidase PhzG [Spongiactinospora sp. 9N601]|uniref:phenazine biosynthesis FMN-dependent oxidase PhzG n=1 Tax=Spongiactinospora sp. 9N601 TaxID=3375149 RepID=UPI0037A23707
MSSKFETISGSTDRAFPEYDLPPAEPLGLAQQWISTAKELGVREPLALALATADGDGHASNRMVAIVDVSARGVIFTSHLTSRKARDIAATGWGSGMLYWRETAQQLSISGPIVRLSDSEEEALWNARPVPLHSMTTASRQSEAFTDFADIARLREEAERLGASGLPLPRPPRFAAFRLEPVVVEFWAAASDRLHRRLRYERRTDGWEVARLQP